jgi:hypothetical protein
VEDLVAYVVALTGIDPHTVQTVLVGLLDLALQTLGPDGARLLSRIPGAAELMAQGLLDPSGASLASLLGHPVDTAAALMDLVRDSGLTPDQVGSIADLLLDHVEQTAGADVADRLYLALPGLAQLG